MRYRLDRSEALSAEADYFQATKISPTGVYQAGFSVKIKIQISNPMRYLAQSCSRFRLFDL